jgi:hypothetical protein
MEESGERESQRKGGIWETQGSRRIHGLSMHREQPALLYLLGTYWVPSPGLGAEECEARIQVAPDKKKKIAANKILLHG